MKISTPTETFSEIYSFYKQISGSHNGIINNKIYQAVNPDNNVKYYAMTADFPDYGRLFNSQGKVAYHLSGYGCTREEALIRLIGESIERYSVVYSHEMLNNEVYYSSYRELINNNKKAMSLDYLNVFDEVVGGYIKNINKEEIIGWFRTTDIFTLEEFYIPAQMFFLGYLNNRRIEEPRAYFGVSTGTAAHTSYGKALENALVEYLQIDSFMLSWYAKDIKVPKVELDDKMKKFIKDQQLISDDFELLILDFTLDKPFPIFGIFIIGKEYPYVSFGVQGGSEPYHTLYRGILEAATILQYNYTCYVYDKDKFELGHSKNNQYMDLDSNVVFWATDIKSKEKMDFLKSRIEGTIEIGKTKSIHEDEVLKSILNYCKVNDYNIGCYDITCSELALKDWYAVRTIIPELLPMCLPGKPFNRHPRMIKYGGCNYEFPHPLP